MRTSRPAARRMTTDRVAVSLPVYQMSEDDLADLVIKLAKILGWQVVHIRPARTEHGWRTPYQGDPGLPDIILAKRGRVIMAELKVGRNKPTLEQRAWLTAAGHNGYLWYPEDRDMIKTILAA